MKRKKRSISDKMGREFVSVCREEVGFSLNGGWEGKALPYGIKASWRRFAAAIRASRASRKESN